MEDPAALAKQQRDDPPAAPVYPGVIYSAVSEGYDRPRGDFPQEFGVYRELRLSQLSGRVATIWNRAQKLIYPPTNARDWSLYIDGSLTPKVPLRGVVGSWLASSDVAAFKHPHRTCAYDEIDACVARGKISADEAQFARTTLKRSKFPADYGLWALGAIARREGRSHDWDEFFAVCFDFVKVVPRDQIWFPYLLWRSGLRPLVHTIDADIFNNDFFSFRPHKT